MERPVLYAVAKGKGELQFQVTPAERWEELLKSMTIEERGVADWIVKNNKCAGATTNTLSHAQNPHCVMDGLRRQNKRCFGVSGFKKIVKAGHVLLKVLSEKNKMIKQLSDY